VDQTAAPARSTYRHGDLRAALLAAGLELASEGGPDAVVLREATRRVGVSPNAAYRHFADRGALLSAVSDAAQGRVADRMEEALGGVDPALPGEAAARRRLRAVGTAYLGFAQEQPGLFRAAFSVPGDLRHALDAGKAGRGGRTPFQILGAVLDDLAAAGALREEHRPGAEFLAWSSVHGLATLVLDGPLRGLPQELVERTRERLLDLVDRGL
jgi:AcrR family transcriptional regulator